MAGSGLEMLRGEKIIGDDLIEEKWIRYFKYLDDYYLENGNLNFPVSYKVNDLRIGDRLYTIRILYNEKKEKLHPKLIKKLEAYDCLVMGTSFMNNF